MECVLRSPLIGLYSLIQSLLSFLQIGAFAVMHVVPSTKSTFISFTNISWMKFVSFAAEWIKCDCKEGNVVGDTLNKLGLDFVNVQSCIDAKPKMKVSDLIIISYLKIYQN